MLRDWSEVCQGQCGDPRAIAAAGEVGNELGSRRRRAHQPLQAVNEPSHAPRPLLAPWHFRPQLFILLAKRHHDLSGILLWSEGESLECLATSCLRNRLG